MELTTSQLEEFRLLYQQEFGVVLGEKEALAQGIGILQLVRASLNNEYDDGTKGLD